MKTQLSDFIFAPSGYGHFKVTYISPVTGKRWTRKTSHLSLFQHYFQIDSVRNIDNPKRKDLDYLKKFCKYGC